MNVYPAIDVLGGRAVRLRQGRREDVTDYGTPLEMAKRWARAGASWLHVVDLDGAFEGRPMNRKILEEIRAACPEVSIQTGGGIRTAGDVDRLVSCGIERIILGTAAVRDPDFLGQVVGRYGERIAVGIDARDGTVRLGGWTESEPVTALELATRMEAAGVTLVIYTDISRDGELDGVNLAGNRRMLEATGLRVIASGGVSSLGDVLRLRDLGHPRLEGVIVGKALYEGSVELEEMLTVAHAG
jgi:phosphoribosylformimino-5-aminoimidazole carboxamide ribotide isomerase